MQAATNLRVSHPTAGLHLVGVEPPELEFLLEERAAHICRVVQFSSSVGKKKTVVRFKICGYGINFGRCALIGYGAQWKEIALIKAKWGTKP